MSCSALLKDLGATEIEPAVTDWQIDRILDTIDYTGKSVLELGARDGRHSIIAMRLGAKSATAVDCRPDHFIRCEPVEFYDADVRQVTFLKPFDVVIATGLLYHLEDPARELRRWVQWTKGHLFISTHCGAGIAIDAEGNIGQWVYEHNSELDAPDGLRNSFWLSQQSIEAIIADAGGEVRRVLQYEIGGRPAHWFEVNVQ